ncbi:MAG: hypothetical protein JWM28_2466, partial [Chitinophagaceae bacterium]|nr:hypothetical protein [Chitinophagaceae bacterium]
MKRIKYKFILPLSTLIVIVVACSKSFLNITPPGTLNAGVLANKIGVEGLLV